MDGETLLDWLIRVTPAKPWSFRRSAGLTALAVGTAFVFRLALDPLLHTVAPFAVFFLAVVVTGYFAGAWYCAAATAASSLLAAYFLIAPRYSWDLAPGGLSSVIVFVFLSCALGGAAVLLRTAVGVLRTRQHELEVTAERARQVADLSPLIMWSARRNGIPDFYNRRWYEFSGADPDVAPQGWDPFVFPEDVDLVRTRWEQALKSGEDYEVEMRLRRADGQFRWFVTRALPFRDSSGKVVRWFGSCTEIHDRKTAIETLETLSHELAHRIKNIFAVVTSLVALSVRNAPEAAPFAAQLRKRLDALGRAHDFARPHSDASRPSAPEPTIFGLVRVLMEPYALEAGERLRIDGEDIEIADRVATPVALVIHELATNASKYGALASPSGKVLITGARDGATYDLVWREIDGPPVTPPDGVLGFGSRLLDVSVGGQLGGSVEREWRPDGVVVTVRMPASAIERDAESPV